MYSLTYDLFRVLWKYSTVTDNNIYPFKKNLSEKEQKVTIFKVLQWLSQKFPIFRAHQSCLKISTAMLFAKIFVTITFHMIYVMHTHYGLTGSNVATGVLCKND